MDPLKPKKNTQPELHVRTKFIEVMERRSWFVHITHGNAYSNGLPDVYAAHVNHGARWIEVKHSAGYHFTDAQKRVFPKLTAKNIGIWVVALSPGFTEQQLEHEYRMLCYDPPNWTKYLGHSRRPY